MHNSSLAPVLSATRSRDSCWITTVSLQRRPASRPAVFPSKANKLAALGCSLRLLDDLHDAPALGGRQRSGLHDEHPVADAALVGLVVDLEVAGAPDDLAVESVLDAVLDDDDHGLVHLVADHQALTGLAEAASLVGGAGGAGAHLVLRRAGCVAHAGAS